MMTDHAFDVRLDVTLGLICGVLTIAGTWTLDRSMDALERVFDGVLKFLRDWC